MSEDKRQHIVDTLSSLSNEDKAWVINFLVQRLFDGQEETTPEISLGRKTAKVVRRHGSPSDDQLQSLIGNEKSPSVPREDFSWSDIISANTGKFIQPIEKWL